MTQFNNQLQGTTELFPKSPSSPAASGHISFFL